MRFTETLQKHWGKALILGVINAVALSAIMVPAFLSGLSPFPKPPSLAFAETLLGSGVPLPVGLLFHVAYVTVWSLIFVAAAYPALTLGRAIGLGLVLWIVLLVVFFPIVGWGVLGLGVSPKLIVASLIPHLLFGVFLWVLARIMFRHSRS